ncbi:hypothetical protein OPIT5_08805 [Opitutaceae bacterium TAV5]|nr:hypothetical protein OPIT5_08805 [Opitutaceae bacterium TAV5]
MEKRRDSPSEIDGRATGEPDAGDQPMAETAVPAHSLLPAALSVFAAPGAGMPRFAQPFRPARLTITTTIPP